MVTRLSGSTRKGKTSRLPLASEWDAECDSGFQTLKTKLVMAPVLAYADFRKPFGKLCPIAYASRGLRRTDRNMENYSSMKLECLALKWVVGDKFREYLLRNDFVIYTDNNPLSPADLKVRCSGTAMVITVGFFQFRD